MHFKTLALALIVLLGACSPTDDKDDNSSSSSSGGNQLTDAGLPDAATVQDAGTQPPDAGVPAADKLQRYLTGRFDTSEQAQADADYMAIQFQSCRANIPALGTRILYVEQAAMSALNSPYRQRLYVIQPGTNPETEAISKVFEFNDPGSKVGFCANPGTITAGEVMELTGCDVFLTWTGTRFEGGTQGKGCLTDFNGATYITSDVKVNETLLMSWDRGWNNADEQQWGPINGHYQFVRRTPLEE